MDDGCKGDGVHLGRVQRCVVAMLTDPPTNTPMCDAGSRGKATSGLKESHLVVGLRPKAAGFAAAALLGPAGPVWR
jgi:hypothetical protein